MSTFEADVPPAEPPAREGPPRPAGPVRLDKSLVDRACLGDNEALRLILHQFIDVEEPIEWCEYLGTLGIQPFGLKSFAVLTANRVGTLRIGWFGYVMYQDAPLEYTVSGMIHQPSKLGLYIWLTINTLVVLVGDLYLFGSLVAPLSVLGVFAIVASALLLALVWAMTVRLYYAFNKCGILWAVREGLWVYAFANRGRMNIANRLHRLAVQNRERRTRVVAPLP
jgi:hypothetical protein